MAAPGGSDPPSRWSLRSRDSVLCLASTGSVLSIGSVGSALSIGSVGSFASVLSIGSFASVGSALAARSRWSLMSWRATGAVQGTPVAARRAGVRSPPVVLAALGLAGGAAIVLTRRR